LSALKLGTYTGKQKQEVCDNNGDVVDSPMRKSPELNPLSRLGNDLLIQATSPLRMSTEEAYWVGASILITAALLLTGQ